MVTEKVSKRNCNFSKVQTDFLKDLRVSFQIRNCSSLWSSSFALYLAFLLCLTKTMCRRRGYNGLAGNRFCYLCSHTAFVFLLREPGQEQRRSSSTNFILEGFEDCRLRTEFCLWLLYTAVWLEDILNRTFYRLFSTISSPYFEISTHSRLHSLLEIKCTECRVG